MKCLAAVIAVLSIACGAETRPTVVAPTTPSTVLSVTVNPSEPEPAPDRDEDGIDDPHDKCPDTPEDKDGVEDDDGCPEEH